MNSSDFEGRKVENAMRRLLLIGSALVLVAGCATNRAFFEPTENAHGRTMHGYREAMYQLSGPNGAFGEAKVWSRGAYRHEDRTVIQVAFELHNTGAIPFELRAGDVLLDPVRAGDVAIANLPPAENSDIVYASGAIGEAQFHFVLPPGVSPGDVHGFRVRWTVRSAQFAYSQNTPFMRERTYAGYAYYPYPYYGWWCDPFDPFCYSPAPGYVVVPGYRYDGNRTIVHPRHY
jgi:hypothetical protein